MAFLDRYDALVFDLNGMLAQGFIRFGPGQDYADTFSATPALLRVSAA